MLAETLQGVWGFGVQATCSPCMPCNKPFSAPKSDLSVCLVSLLIGHTNLRSVTPWRDVGHGNYMGFYLKINERSWRTLSGRGTLSDLFLKWLLWVSCWSRDWCGAGWVQENEEEESLFRSPGGSLDEGGAGVNGEKEMDFWIIVGKNKTLVMGVVGLKEREVSKLTPRSPNGSIIPLVRFLPISIPNSNLCLLPTPEIILRHQLGTL